MILILMQISHRLDKELETQILARGQFKCMQESDGSLLKASLSDRVDPTVKICVQRQCVCNNEAHLHLNTENIQGHADQFQKVLSTKPQHQKYMG